MNVVLWVEAVVLLAAAVLAALGVAGKPPEVALGTIRLSETVVRAVLALFTLAFLGGAGVCGIWWGERRGLSHLLRQPGPRGPILITPRTVSQVAAGLIAQELGETPFRVIIQPGQEAVSLRVLLRLPPEDTIPNLAERLQELLVQELARRTGLKVQEVQVVVHGASPASP